MSLYRLVYIRCNGCGKLHGTGDTSHTAARNAARADGWRKLSGRPIADYCPRCSQHPDLKGLLK